MNRTIAIIFVLLLFCSCNSPVKKSNEQLIKKLDTYIETSDFFKLKSVYEAYKTELSETQNLYYNAIINNVFNQAEKSNLAILTLLESHASSVTDTMLNELYGRKLLNHVNLFEYAEAAKTSELILNNFEALNDSTELENLRNEIKIWSALKDVGKQEIIKTGDATIPMVKDKVGLFNVDVTFGETTKNLLFDTGANFSVLVKSVALELGFSIIEANFYVTAATGLKVKSDIAIAPELTIGSITFKNVFFLVLEDKDLSFPQIEYYINGAIGFPVIEAMEEIRVRKNNQIFVPLKPAKYSFNNFALNGLMPILATVYKGDTLRFNFDTGATTTSMYQQFYKDYKNQIENDYEKQIFTAGSGGGMVAFEGYVINELNLKVADSDAKLDSVRLHIENIGGEKSHFHGNFGQDYIKQFDEMIISFKYASVSFK